MIENITDQQGELALSPTTARIVRLGARIKALSTDSPEFLHTILCQVGLPRKKVTGTQFERTNGKASLLIKAGDM